MVNNLIEDLIKSRYTTKIGHLETQKYICIKNPFDESVIAEIGMADEKMLDLALNISHNSFKKYTSQLKTFERAQILANCANIINEKKEQFAKVISLESGKPILDARVEVDRAVNTFNLASRILLTQEDTVIPMDITPQSNGRFAFTTNEPIGVVLAITPFNFPLNLVAHKIAPAIACGNSIILKPASQTPITSLMLKEVLEKAGFDENAFLVLCVNGSQCDKLVTSDKINALTFTGSPEIGWKLTKKVANGVRCILELGGNAASIVHKDADIELACQTLVKGSFSYSGQICISVQRIYVHKSICQEFTKKFVELAQKIKAGNPIDPNTQLGPMINKDSIKNTIDIVDEAIGDGAKVLLKGKIVNDSILTPTILYGTKNKHRAMCQEIFGPVVSINEYENIEDAIDSVNDSNFGIQASVYTNSLDTAFKAIRGIDTTGVLINDPPSFRADHIPYGGRKQSGFGLEGVKYAMQEMVKIKYASINFIN